MARPSPGGSMARAKASHGPGAVFAGDRPRGGSMEQQTTTLPKLTSTGATALVVANMIGTGIFVTSGFMARDLAHPWAVLGVWALGGLLALCGASIYGELGGMMPRAGGEYVYLSRAFNPAV